MILPLSQDTGEAAPSMPCNPQVRRDRRAAVQTADVVCTVEGVSGATSKSSSGTPSRKQTPEVAKSALKRAGTPAGLQKSASITLGRSKSSPDLRSVLWPSKGASPLSVRRLFGRNVSFNAQLEFYNDGDVDAWSLFKFLIKLMLAMSPLRQERSGDIPRYTGSLNVNRRFATPSILGIPPLSWPALCHFLFWLVLPCLYSLTALIIPINADAQGGLDLPFSLGVVFLWGIVKSFYAMLWFEAYFGTTVDYRYFIVAAAGTLAPIAHISLSAASGSLLYFGISLSGAFVDIAVSVGVYFMLPKKDGLGVKGQLVISVSLLLAFTLSLNLLKMLNTANARGPQMGYMLMLILPPIFTRLTTDIQEALPNVSLEFSIVSQGLLTYAFSISTYNILVFFSLQIRLWKFYLVILAADTACMFAVGPIWSLWSTAGYLRTSKYMQTIFGWAQNPIKPRPVLVKYYTRFLAALVFSVVLSIVKSSGNGDVMNAAAHVDDNTKLGDLWACTLADALISAFWVIFMYRLMKLRCSKDAFNDAVIQFSKNLCDIQLGATVSTLMLFLINSKGENGLDNYS
ncbi:unnamed protein product [Ostreobium quekettii]|uniref:Uncharacterized protein n=1 Tax=Ostreobium quekettii TaxID=121088 RepID=A0A8S1IMF1_9CHLO|nr:unnamed protein product [Ostreobium quekettii]